jgi:hypothetical protein
MKRVYLLILFITIIFNSHLFANPFFTIGSNKYFTIFAYPHDLLKYPRSRAVYFGMTPQTLPWMGDLTNIANRPSDSYTSAYQSVEFETPSGYTGDPNAIKSYMNLSSYLYKDQYNFGGVYTTNFGAFLIELSSMKYDMELTSNGIGRAYETVGSQTEYYLVPFDAATLGKQNYTSLQFIYANEFFNIPMGLKFIYQKKKSDQASGYLNFTDKGVSYNTSHLTWAWATFGCAKIFGYSHINADAFFENSYTIYNGSEIDMQGSFEINNNFKTGIRYRKTHQDGDNYTWKDDASRKNYGYYYMDPNWKNAIYDDLLRAYSKVNLIKMKQGDAGLLFFLQYDNYSQTRENKLIESDPASKANTKEFTIETNPYINYKLADGGYFDAGILIEFSKAFYKNTSDRWNSVAGSTQKDVYWETTPNNGWDYSWENFSKGGHYFFSFGIELNPSINIYKGLNLDIRLDVVKKYSNIEKVYGKPEVPAGQSSFSFTQKNVRNNFKDETWAFGEIGFQYRIGTFDILFGYQTPVAYLLQKETKLNDNSKQLFEHTVKNTWQVQTPSGLRLQVVCDFDFSKGFDF